MKFRNRFFRAGIISVCLMAACNPETPTSEAAPSLGGRSEGTWYQIFSYSFFDSDGDGIGDLNGIAQKLDYLNDSHLASHARSIARTAECNNSLHIKGIWLTPIMPSPSYHKYDTKDYMNIDPTFGTLNDFQTLVAECHKRGIKLIIDLVMNHSSQDHPWFQEALKEVKSGNPGRYASYYHFYYGGTPPENYKFKVPWDNGASYYKWWGWVDGKAWYEGSFWTGMPDLNWDSLALREEFEDIIEFWLNAGLDGFRLDATSWPYKFLGMERFQEGQHEDKNIELWTWFSDTCKKYNPNVYLVGECWEDKNSIAEYYRSGMNYFGFQFSLGGERKIYNAVLNAEGDGFAKELVWWDRALRSRFPDAISAPFLSNHDQPRSSTVLGDDPNRKMAGALLTLSPGTPFVYYGEEIAMTSPPYEQEKPDSDRRGPMCWSWPKVGGMPDPPPNGNGRNKRPKTAKA